MSWERKWAWRNSLREEERANYYTTCDLGVSHHKLQLQTQSNIHIIVPLISAASSGLNHFSLYILPWIHIHNHCKICNTLILFHRHIGNVHWDLMYARQLEWLHVTCTCTWLSVYWSSCVPVHASDKYSIQVVQDSQIKNESDLRFIIYTSDIPYFYYY